MKVIYFDTETSGLNCRNCKIIELAMLTVVDGEIVEEYDEFINIGQALSPKIISLTGITNEMLAEEGRSEETVAIDLKKKLTEDTIMIAHNAQFDLSFIYFLLKRHYPDEAEDIVGNIQWLDTLTVLKDRMDYPHKLVDAVEHYGVEKVNFHRAIDDTKALYSVTQELKLERDDLEEYINIFGYNPKYGVGKFRFPFITYKPQYYHNRGKLPPNEILPKK
ncbi:PolC-type DNA polymerase III [uncultured Methanobrevibacter sp.]|uniref:3'-5' exonuclease n=1 Tax=uncultured Methanobrevibacter sp. TaxID=253161 RepID=UPI0025F63B05|nr:3'-5' exonuclease [uncultured Methanobrevibacter sp.]